MADLIDRQAAIDALKPCAGVGNRALDKLRTLPSVEPERKTGRWIQWAKGRVMCSICRKEPFHGKGADRLNFCPNCGAKMEVEHEAD